MPGDGEQQNVQTPAVQNPSGTQGSSANGEQANATPEGGQTVSQKWMSQLPDELKGNAELAKHSSLGEALR